MDTLNAIPARHSQDYGTVQALAKKGNQSDAVATPITVMPVEQKELNQKQQITNAVKDINNFFQSAQRSLGFTVDEASGQMVMQIKDTETNELIRQIPGEDVLKLAKRLDDLTGILFKAQA